MTSSVNLPGDLTADVLLVTAVPCEHQALKKTAAVLELPWKRFAGQAADYHHLGVVGDLRVAVIQLESMGSFSATGSAFTCYRAMLETSATTVIAVGIAFGIDETSQRIGDLLVAESLHLYDEGDVVDDGEDSYKYTYPYPDRVTVTASTVWVEQFRRAAVARAVKSASARVPHFGKLLAGGARIESRRFRDHLRARVGDAAGVIVGGEMEAAGIAAACATRGASWAVVKGVSDFATKESRAQIKETRAVAASAAAEFTLTTLKDLPRLRGDSP